MFGKKELKEVVIGTPRDLQHNIHVNKELDWHVRDPETSFKLEEKLGEGSFGVVYKAMHLDSLHEIAVKIIEVDLAQTMDLQNEITILKKCMHPNIVSYFGSCATEKKLWILMDYCGLGSVRDVIETCKRTLTEKEIACVCAQTLKGLQYLHHFEQPIIHKDIKAANILLTELGEVKLADFGVAQQILTTLCLGYLEGTPHFMAPEIGNASKFNFKADIWSLGITAIEMADGRPPIYAEINIMRAIHMIRRYPPPTLREPKKWSKDFNNFIARCLVKDYNDRATAEELLQHPFITGARPQAMRDLCHEALKAKKKFRNKQKKETSNFSHSTPPPSSMSGWRTDKKAKSLVVRSTYEQGNQNYNGSVVILSTVNVGRTDTYHSYSDDSLSNSSQCTMASSSSRTSRTSLSSSSSPYATIHFHDTVVETPEGDEPEYGTVQFNDNITEASASDSVRIATNHSDAIPLAARKKRPLSTSLSIPQVLSETDESHTEVHEEGNEVQPEVLNNNKDTPSGTKETRSIGVQTDLPLDLKLFMDSVMRKKRHKQYTETHELKYDHKSRRGSTKLSNSSGVVVKRSFMDRFSPHRNLESPTGTKLSISSSGADDTEVVAKSTRPRVPPLPLLPHNIDLGESVISPKVKSPRTVKDSKSPRTPRDSKSPRTPRDSKSPKTPKGNKGESREDSASLPQKSPRRKFGISEYLSGLLPNVVVAPFIGLYSGNDDSQSESEPSLRFQSCSEPSPLASSIESSLPSCSPPSSPTSSSIDTALDSSLDSLRSSITSPTMQPVLQVIMEEEEPNRDSPYITPYSTTDESSDSAPADRVTSPFATTNPAPFTGPIQCRSQENTPVSSLLLSPPMSSSSTHFAKNTTPDTTPDTTPVTSPDATPRQDDMAPSDSSLSADDDIPPSSLDDAIDEGLHTSNSIIQITNNASTSLNVTPGTPRPLNARNPSPLQPDTRMLTRVNATSKLGDQVRAVMHTSDSLETDSFGYIPATTPKSGPPIYSTSTPSPPKQPVKNHTNSTTSKSATSKTSSHRISHSAPVLPSPPLKHSTKTQTTTKSNNLNASSVSKPATPSTKLMRTTSMRYICPNLRVPTSSPDNSPPQTSGGFPHNDPTPAPSVENIKQTLLLSSSPPKPAPIKRTASILNTNMLTAFLPKSVPPPPQPAVTPSNTLVRSLSIAFSTPAENPSARPRSNSNSALASTPVNSAPPSPLTRTRASTISGIASPTVRPPIPKTGSSNLNAPIPNASPSNMSPSNMSPSNMSPSNMSPSNMSPSNTTVSSLNNADTHAKAPSPSPSTLAMPSRIPTRTNSHNQPISYASMRHKSNIPLPKSAPRARSASDLATATLDSPPLRPQFYSNKSTTPNLTGTPSTASPPPESVVIASPSYSIFESLAPVPSSLEIPDTDSCHSDIPPLSLTPSPPSSPASSRSPTPESSSPSPHNSPRNNKSEKSPPSLLSSARPFNRHSQHARYAAHSHNHPKSDSPKSKKGTSPQPPQPSTSPLRRTTSSTGIPAHHSISSPTLATPSSSLSLPLPTAADRSPRKAKSPKKEITEKAKSPKSPKSTGKEKDISEKTPSPKEGFSIRLPGGIKFPSYSPRSPRRARNSPRSPRPQSANKRLNTPSPLSSSPPLPSFSPNSELNT